MLPKRYEFISGGYPGIKAVKTTPDAIPNDQSREIVIPVFVVVLRFINPIIIAAKTAKIPAPIMGSKPKRKPRPTPP